MRVTAVMMVISWVWRIFWNYKCWNILIDDWAFQVVLVVKTPPAIAGDLRDTGSIPCLGRSLGGRHSNPLQHSCLKNPVDRRAWWAIVIPLHTVRHNWGDLACTPSFYCASLYYIYIYKLKFCGNFASRISISAIFPKVIFSLCLSATFW